MFVLELTLFFLSFCFFYNGVKGFLPSSQDDFNSFLHQEETDSSRITSYGLNEGQPKEFKMPKPATYIVGGQEVGKKEFIAALEKAGIPLDVASTVGKGKKTGSQDNYLIDIYQDSEGKPIFGLFSVTDGHGDYGHALSEIIRTSLTRSFQSDMNEYLDIEGGPELQLNTSSRVQWIRTVITHLYETAQADYENSITYKDTPPYDDGARLLYRLSREMKDSLSTAMNKFMYSGAVLGVTIVDYRDEKMYVASAGDTVTFAKFSGEKTIVRVATDHSASSRRERLSIIDRSTALGMTFQAADARYPPSVSLLFGHPPGPRAPPATVALSLAIYPSRDLEVVEVVDYRVNAAQPSRGIGHWYEGTGTTHAPEINVIDLKRTPVDYVVMGSDGLVHGVSRLVSMLAQRLLKKIERYENDGPGKLAWLFSELFQLAASSNSTESIFKAWNLFGEEYEKTSMKADEIQNLIFKVVLDAYAPMNTSQAVEALCEEGNVLNEDFNPDDFTLLIFQMNLTRPAVYKDVPPTLNGTFTHLYEYCIPSDVKLLDEFDDDEEDTQRRDKLKRSLGRK